MSIEHLSIFNKAAIKLSIPDYEAIIVPEYGCNLISLYHKKLQLEILKKPLNDDREEFMTAPQHFGNAILFPPNRISHGCYTKNGKHYSFVPENLSSEESETFMYSHGILRFMPFTVDSCKEENESIVVCASYHSVDGGEIYKNFPHEFICRMKFELSSKGLHQTIEFENKSNIPMPLGVGFHTAFQLPNDDVSDRDDYRIVLAAGERIQLGAKNIPTGVRSELQSNYRTEGILPFKPIIDEHTSVLPLSIDGKDFHGAIIKNIRTKHNIYFETSETFGYWMLWNNQARSNYVCIEPMSWIIDAPNSPLPDNLTGYQNVQPETTWTSTLRISAN